jgi:hypothetical protein
MQVITRANDLELILFDPECALLRDVLEQLVEAYEKAPDLLDPRVRGVWYPGEGFKSAAMSEEDADDWNKSLAEFRGENGLLCRSWLEVLDGRGPEQPTRLLVPFSEVDRFLTVINEYRLMKAAEQELGEEDMARSLELVELPSKRSALLEVHFLGWLLELVLAAMRKHPGVL